MRDVPFSNPFFKKCKLFYLDFTISLFQSEKRDSGGNRNENESVHLYIFSSIEVTHFAEAVDAVKLLNDFLYLSILQYHCIFSHFIDHFRWQKKNRKKKT